MRIFIAAFLASAAFLLPCGRALADERDGGEPPVLALRLSTQSEEFNEDEPIYLTLEIENVSDESVLIADHADFFVFHLLLHFEDGAFTPLIREDEENRTITLRQHPAAVLYPSGYYGVKIDVRDYVRLSPGEHRLKVTYVNKMGADKVGFDAWKGSVVSNEITVVLREKDPELVRILKLIEQLGDDSWEVRENATKELIEIGEPAIDHLAKAIKESSDAEVVWRANIILRKLGYVSDLVIAQKVEDILEGIKKDNWLVKQTRGMEIVRLGPRVIGTLRPYLKHEDHRIRQIVVELLGRIPDKKIIPLLIGALDDRDAYVRTSAAKELRRITGRDFTSYDKDKWKEWWKENKTTFELPES